VALEHIMGWFPLNHSTDAVEYLQLDDIAADVFDRDKDYARAAIAKAKGDTPVGA